VRLQLAKFDRVSTAEAWRSARRLDLRPAPGGSRLDWRESRSPPCAPFDVALRMPHAPGYEQIAAAAEMVLRWRAGSRQSDAIARCWRKSSRGADSPGFRGADAVELSPTGVARHAHLRDAVTRLTASCTHRSNATDLAITKRVLNQGHRARQRQARLRAERGFTKVDSAQAGVLDPVEVALTSSSRARRRLHRARGDLACQVTRRTVNWARCRSSCISSPR